MRPHPICSDHNLCARHTTHLRRRAQRAEEEEVWLTDRLKVLRAEIAAERAALEAYLNGPEHEYDLMLGAQTHIGHAVRDMTETHQTCHHCGGFTRKALEALLEPTLIKRRMALGLPPSIEARAGDWPVRKGAGRFRGKILQPYQSPSKDAGKGVY